MNDERPTSPQEAKFLTIPEVAKFFRVSAASIYRIVERRDIAFYRTPRRILFRASDVEAYLKKCRVEPYEEPVPRRKPNPVQ